jgi:transposase-like protein
VARNQIQFQAGMSLDQFMASYGTDEQCEAALTRWRWPDGFVCPHCASTDHAVVGKRRLYLCHGCRRQTSLIAGTIFSKTQLPLRRWFQALWLITQSKNSISTLSLSRQIGVKWDSAWLMRQKLAEVMIGREAGRRLEGRIEVDDAVMGGEQPIDSGGKQGRSGSNKTPFVVAVETRDGRPQRVQFHTVSSHNRAEIRRIAAANFVPGSHVVSDGLDCFKAVREAGCTHDATVTNRIVRPQKLIRFHWVNTVIGNLKTATTGTFHSIRPHYVHRYLAEFQYRFNRRSNLPAMLARLAFAAVRTAPKPYAKIRCAYAGG